MLKTLTVTLPESLAQYIQQRVDEGDYSDPSHYVRHLVRDERRTRAEEQLEAMLLDGLESGEPQEATEEYWAELEGEAEAKVQKRLSAKKSR